MITCWSVPLPAATHHQPQLPDALISVMWAPGSPRQHAVICWRCCVHCSARFNSPRRVRPRSGVAGCAAPPWAGHWVVLVVVGEIAYRAFTRDQSFRHPPWCGVRPDRDATAIHQPSRPAVDTMGLLSSSLLAGRSDDPTNRTSGRHLQLPGVPSRINNRTWCVHVWHGDAPSCGLITWVTPSEFMEVWASPPGTRRPGTPEEYQSRRRRVRYSALRLSQSSLLLAERSA
jgi:hypothetical protein